MTVADFTVQALVLGVLSRYFPGHGFIAEESSSVLRQDPESLSHVLSVVRTVLGRQGLAEAELCAAIDLGTRGHGKNKRGRRGKGGRTWVLDPIDGTKGFLRGEQFCVALVRKEGGKGGCGAYAWVDCFFLVRRALYLYLRLLRQPGAVSAGVGWPLFISRKRGISQCLNRYAPSLSQARQAESKETQSKNHRRQFIKQRCTIVLSSPPSASKPRQHTLKSSLLQGLLDGGKAVAGVLGCPNLPCHEHPSDSSGWAQGGEAR